MTQIVTVYGCAFTVESDGWRGLDDDRDEAVSNLEMALSASAPEAVAALHAALAAEGEYPDAAVRLCHDVTAPVTGDWHDPDAPALMLGAA